jgi:hypothetical protein
MRQRGRKSGEGAMALARISGLETLRRPDPPSELTDEQADEWRAVVGRMAADWFPRETFGLLCQYVRHVSRARRLAQLADEMERSPGFDVGEYAKLAAMEIEQSRAMASLATRMRISQQSSYDKMKKKPGPTATEMPWEPYAKAG